MKILELLTIKEASKLTDYTPQNITRKIRANELTAYRRGRQYFVKLEDVREIVKVVGYPQFK